jgi:hypothetical protein
MTLPISAGFRIAPVHVDNRALLQLARPAAQTPSMIPALANILRGAYGVIAPGPRLAPGPGGGRERDVVPPQIARPTTDCHADGIARSTWTA